jgi:hypothetical protein
MNVGTLLYKQYTHLVTDDLKIDTETSYVHVSLHVSLHVLLLVSLLVSLQVSLHASLHMSLRHTEWALQVAPRMSVELLQARDQVDVTKMRSNSTISKTFGFSTVCWTYIGSTQTAIRLTRRNCVPTGYGPSSAVGALEDLVGRSRVRTQTMQRLCYHI